MAQLVRMSALLLMAMALAGCSTGVSAQLACGNWTELSGYSCLQLDDAYNVYWRGEPALNRVWIGVEVQGDNSTVPNWVGFGVSTQGGMKGAAITVIRSNASANGDRTWQLESQYSTAYAMPMPVTVPGVALQSIVTLPAQGIVRALFYRPLDACVNGSIRIEPGQPHVVIWAYGMGEYDLGHTSTDRGNSFLTFLPPPPVPAPTPNPAVIRPGPDINSTFSTANTTTSATLSSTQAIGGFSNTTINTTSESIVSFLFPPHEIPTSMNYYGCYDFQVPDVDQGRQIIGTVGIENAPIGGYVHHMVLYACDNPQPNLGTGRMYQCMTMPDNANCLLMVAVWVPGAQSTMFPPETGVTIGPSGYKYFSLQIHYHNPTATPGIIDQSGIQLLVTSQPRKYEVGTLVLGSVGFNLAPGQPYIKLNESWCPSSCTRRFPTNITAFSAMLHAHQTGASISVRHLRNGQELRPIAETAYYDYRFQHNHPVTSDTSLIAQGDELITTCAYNTLDRTNVTTAGEGTEQEMCFAFIQYWPRMKNISACVQSQTPMAQSLSVATCAPLGLLAGGTAGQPNLQPAQIMQFMQNGVLTSVTKSTFTPYEMYGPQCEARVNASMAMYASQAPQPATMDATRQRLRRMLRKE